MVKNCIGTLCTGEFTHVSHYWWKQSFHVFGTGFDRASARLETAKNVLLHPTRHILSQHPCLHPTPQSGYNTVTIAKTTNNCIHCISAHPTPPHTNPMESGPGNTFSAQNRKKPKRFMISNIKRGGVHFSTFLTPPPHIPTPKKKGFQVRGGKGGGSGPKTHWGMHLLDKIMVLQGVKPTIQPLGVGCMNEPKKAQNGGGLWGSFPHRWAFLALI